MVRDDDEDSDRSSPCNWWIASSIPTLLLSLGETLHLDPLQKRIHRRVETDSSRFHTPGRRATGIQVHPDIEVFTLYDLKTTHEHPGCKELTVCSIMSLELDFQTLCPSAPES